MIRASACFGLVYSYANNTKLIVGEVSLIEIDDGLRQPDGGIALERAGSLASTALDTYFTLNGHKQLDYAKP